MTEDNKFAKTIRIEIPAEFTSAASPSSMSAPPALAMPVKPIIESSSIIAHLEEGEAKLYQEFLQSIYDAVIISDLNGIVVDGNGRALDFLHYTHAELCARMVFDIVCGFNAGVLATIINNLENDRFTLVEAFCRRNDRTIFPAEIASSLVHFGASPYLCFFVRDITKRKQDENDLVRTRAQLDRAERLEMAGSIAGHIAHDFNNLLTPMLAYPDFIREALPPDSPAHQDLDIIARTAQQIANINQQLLALSRRGYHEHRALNINTIIQDVTMLLQHSGQNKGIKINLQLDDQLLNIKGSADQLLRVIHNLSQNAIDAMEGNGQLSISTESVYLEKPLKIYESVAQGEYVKLTISDTGHGVPPEIQDKIFDPFFTTKQANRQRGSGLGLSVVHGIVKDHSGYIDLESLPGRGATFKIYFPVCREEATVETEQHYSGGSETILVVDDDPMQIEVTTRMLTKLGYTVLSAPSGEEALKLVQKIDPNTSDLPELAILDMIMGNGIDGTETYRRLKEIHSKQRAIILSGYAESGRVAIAQDLGVGAYLRKPINLDKLALAVRQELDR